MKKFLITGGAGFIGSALIRHLINNTDHHVVNIDNLTYAGNLESLSKIKNNERYSFEKIDICNLEKIRNIFETYQPDIIIHLAASTHVDRSIETPDEFIQTNIFGTYILLNQAKNYWAGLKDYDKKNNFRFHHVSTDEVYGDLNISDELFTEKTSYAPSSPYSASKASSDHLVRAWHRTFKLPTLITNCSNNYGPFQFPEKLIPLTILNALEAKSIPVYGNGKQVRDWLYVDDHAKALLLVALSGTPGETYNIGGHNAIENIDVIRTVCQILDKIRPSKIKGISKYEKLITYIDDRPGHDLKYAVDASKIFETLGWSPDQNFNSGILKTVEWYLNNKVWWEKLQDCRNKEPWE